MRANTQHVFVSGCFDLLHSGHVEFLQQAASFGRLTVALGSDRTIHALKGRYPVCRQDERLFMVRALRCVETVLVSSGSGITDFEPDLRRLRPDLFVVNLDGDNAAKRQLCQELGIEYRVLERVPARSLPARCTTDLRQAARIPYRIDLAGGWLDQPFVSQLHPGPVIVVGLEPSAVFAGRSGLATSTRTTAERLWGVQLPHGDPVEQAKLLFACENPPGTVEVAGSQDALGIALPGVNRLDYAGQYWPHQITTHTNSATLRWLEEHLFLQWLGERAEAFDVLGDTHLSVASANRLALAANQCWQAVLARDAVALGATMRDSFESQLAMFPRMLVPSVGQAISALPPAATGYKLCGAGGGGYLAVIATTPPEHFERVQIRFAES